MKKWVTFGLVAAASLGLTAMAVADVPSELTSTVACYCEANAGGVGASSMLPLHCTVAPDGGDPSDDIHVDVVVNNILGNPLQNSNVIATHVAVSGASADWCAGDNPQAQLSAADGSADFIFDNGTVNLPGVVEVATSDFDVTADGPGPGGPVALADCPDQLYVISFDVDGLDLVVDIVDFAVFASTLGSVDARTDFDHSTGATDIVDFAMFSAHLNKACP